MAHCTLALGPDTAGGLLHQLVESCAGELDLAVYETGPGYAALLARAASRGVRVRLLLDAHAGANATASGIAAAGGVACRVLGGHPGVEAHWKLVLAGATLATGTGNLLKRDAPLPGQPGTREWWAHLSAAPGLRREARDAFDAAWAEAMPPPLAWRRAAAVVPVVPPVGVPPHPVEPLHLDIPAARLRLVLGGAPVGALLAARIAAARARALVTVPYVHARVAAVRTLLAALAAAAERGADVRLLLGTAPDPADAAELATFQHASGARVRVMDPLRCTTGHAKGVVADAGAMVCSANWSGAGLGGNRESALLLDDGRAADYFAAALDHDWALARPLRTPPMD